MGLLIDGAMQQAAQEGRQFMGSTLSLSAHERRQQGPSGMPMRQ
jgi:hypothetical protein